MRKITPDGTVSTLAGSTPGFANGPGSTAMFYSPIAIAADASGNVYVSDYGNVKIPFVAPDGSTSMLASSTTGFAEWLGNASMFNAPGGLAVRWLSRAKSRLHVN